jgi:hypothetical protein
MVFDAFRLLAGRGCVCLRGRPARLAQPRPGMDQGGQWLGNRDTTRSRLGVQSCTDNATECQNHSDRDVGGTGDANARLLPEAGARSRKTKDGNQQQDDSAEQAVLDEQQRKCKRCPCRQSPQHEAEPGGIVDSRP